MPPSKNPIDDPDGAECARNQPKDLWFLAGTHGGTATRTCRLPSGTSIYFPVLNQICAASAGSGAAAVDECTGAADQASATLDGHSLKITEADSGGVFDFVAKANSSTGFDQGSTHAVAWGLWVGPVPLTDGKHVLHFEAAAGSFSLAVTYHLQVG